MFISASETAGVSYKGLGLTEVGLTVHFDEHSAKLRVSYCHSGQIGFSSSGHFRRTVNCDAVRVAFRSMSAASADPMAVHQASDTLRNDPAIRAANLTTYLGSF